MKQSDSFNFQGNEKFYYNNAAHNLISNNLNINNQNHPFDINTNKDLNQEDNLNHKLQDNAINDKKSVTPIKNIANSKQTHIITKKPKIVEILTFKSINNDIYNKIKNFLVNLIEDKPNGIPIVKEFEALPSNLSFKILTEKIINYKSWKNTYYNIYYDSIQKNWNILVLALIYLQDHHNIFINNLKDDDINKSYGPGNNELKISLECILNAIQCRHNNNQNDFNDNDLAIVFIDKIKYIVSNKCMKGLADILLNDELLSLELPCCNKDRDNTLAKYCKINEDQKEFAINILNDIKNNLTISNEYYIKAFNFQKSDITLYKSFLNQISFISSTNNGLKWSYIIKETSTNYKIIYNSPYFLRNIREILKYPDLFWVHFTKRSFHNFLINLLKVLHELFEKTYFNGNISLEDIKYVSPIELNLMDMYINWLYDNIDIEDLMMKSALDTKTKKLKISSIFHHIYEDIKHVQNKASNGNNNAKITIMNDKSNNIENYDKMKDQKLNEYQLYPFTLSAIIWYKMISWDKLNNLFIYEYITNIIDLDYNLFIYNKYELEYSNDTYNDNIQILKNKNIKSINFNIKIDNIINFYEQKLIKYRKIFDHFMYLNVFSMQMSILIFQVDFENWFQNHIVKMNDLKLILTPDIIIAIIAYATKLLNFWYNDPNFMIIKHKDYPYILSNTIQHTEGSEYLEDEIDYLISKILTLIEFNSNLNRENISQNSQKIIDSKKLYDFIIDKSCSCYQVFYDNLNGLSKSEIKIPLDINYESDGQNELKNIINYFKDFFNNDLIIDLKLFFSFGKKYGQHNNYKNKLNFSFLDYFSKKFNAENIEKMIRFYLFDEINEYQNFINQLMVLDYNFAFRSNISDESLFKKIIENDCITKTKTESNLDIKINSILPNKHNYHLSSSWTNSKSITRLNVDSNFSVENLIDPKLRLINENNNIVELADKGIYSQYQIQTKVNNSEDYSQIIRNIFDDNSIRTKQGTYDNEKKCNQLIQKSPIDKLIPSKSNIKNNPESSEFTAYIDDINPNTTLNLKLSDSNQKTSDSNVMKCCLIKEFSTKLEYSSNESNQESKMIHRAGIHSAPRGATKSKIFPRLEIRDLNILNKPKKYEIFPSNTHIEQTNFSTNNSASLLDKFRKNDLFNISNHIFKQKNKSDSQDVKLIKEPIVKVSSTANDTNFIKLDKKYLPIASQENLFSSNISLDAKQKIENGFNGKNCFMEHKVGITSHAKNLTMKTLLIDNKTHHPKMNSLIELTSGTYKNDSSSSNPLKNEASSSKLRCGSVSGNLKSTKASEEVKIIRIYPTIRLVRSKSNINSKDSFNKNPEDNKDITNVNKNNTKIVNCESILIYKYEMIKYLQKCSAISLLKIFHYLKCSKEIFIKLIDELLSSSNFLHNNAHDLANNYYFINIDDTTIKTFYEKNGSVCFICTINKKDEASNISKNNLFLNMMKHAINEKKSVFGKTKKQKISKSYQNKFSKLDQTISIIFAAGRDYIFSTNTKSFYNYTNRNIFYSLDFVNENNNEHNDNNNNIKNGVLKLKKKTKSNPENTSNKKNQLNFQQDLNIIWELEENMINSQISDCDITSMRPNNIYETKKMPKIENQQSKDSEFDIDLLKNGKILNRINKNDHLHYKNNEVEKKCGQIKWFIQHCLLKHENEFWNSYRNIKNMLGFKRIFYYPCEFIAQLTNNTMKFNPMTWNYLNIKHITDTYITEGYLIFDFYDKLLFPIFYDPRVLLKDNTKMGSSNDLIKQDWVLAEINSEDFEKLKLIIYMNSKVNNMDIDTSVIFNILEKYCFSEIRERCCFQYNKTGKKEEYSENNCSHSPLKNNSGNIESLLSNTDTSNTEINLKAEDHSHNCEYIKRLNNAIRLIIDVPFNMNDNDKEKDIIIKSLASKDIDEMKNLLNLESFYFMCSLIEQITEQKEIQQVTTKNFEIIKLKLNSFYIKS